MKFKCAICGNVLGKADGRSSSLTKSFNMILLLCHSLAGERHSESARTLAESITRHNIKICHVHAVHAAQYLAAEMALAGKRFSHFRDPKAHGRTAFVTDLDIPKDIVSVLNTLAKGSVTITPREVSKFLNDALKRYYSTPFWPVTEQDDRVYVKSEVVEAEDEWEAANASTAADGSTAEEDNEEPSLCPPEVSAKDLLGDDLSECCSDTLENASESSKTSSSFFEPVIRKTDPDVFDRYFLVKGSQLMELFQFCPRCGCRLNGTELVGVGVAAVVKFVCKGCSTDTPNVQLWKSQELPVNHSKERT
ncbi:hypothetical protein OSTOST_20082 [Ostertagia ostertagi]